MPSVRVFMLPALGDPASLKGGISVVIDVLRASTTIVECLANGARAVIPAASIEQALSRAKEREEQTYLLGGERQGQRIPGFDLGNSPLEYTRERISGKDILFTTTNGTKALLWSAQAETILVASLTNRAAMLDRLRKETRPIFFLCAGTNGCLTAEDILLAGFLAKQLHQPTDPLDVETGMAIDFAERNGQSAETILSTLRNSRGGQNLMRIHGEQDLLFAAQCDIRTVIPQFHPASGEIRSASPA